MKAVANIGITRELNQGGGLSVDGMLYIFKQLRLCKYDLIIMQ
jgi:hypothetical protein